MPLRHSGCIDLNEELAVHFPSRNDRGPTPLRADRLPPDFEPTQYWKDSEQLPADVGTEILLMLVSKLHDSCGVNKDTRRWIRYRVE